jgi:hypothetical protein
MIECPKNLINEYPNSTELIFTIYPKLDFEATKEYENAIKSKNLQNSKL